MNDKSTELILQDVRCFHGEQRGRVKPITLLVGENGTGKTTFLSCFSVLHRLFSERWSFDQQLDFNRAPFSMGSFRDIVSSKRESEAKIKQFKLGLEISQNGSQFLHPFHLVTTFSEQGSQPVISSFRYEFDDDLFLEFKRGGENNTIVVIPEMEVNIGISFNHTVFLLDMLDDAELSDRAEISDRMAALNRNLFPLVNYLNRVLDTLTIPSSRANRENKGNFFLLYPALNKPIPVAPLRSKPKRTYDPIREIQSPEGEHIPMLMMRLDLTDKNGWTSLHDSLVKFGRESGMFSDITVKRHGKQMSDPFQLQVEVRTGSPANIMDVGYGISQSLPILVDVMASEKNLSMNHESYRTFLMQQPEVHLHPRAQAELASFFADSYYKCGNRFLIETHSDYIIDRLRIEVRTGNLQAEDVSILYFESTENGVNIHSLSLDKYGNLEGAPDSYREFFMKETDRVLGFTD